MLDVSVIMMNLRAIFSTLNIRADFSIFRVSCKRMPQDTTAITISLGTFGVLILRGKETITRLPVNMRGNVCTYTIPSVMRFAL